jgi:acyl-homoserine lactone acylase PvdQ
MSLPGASTTLAVSVVLEVPDPEEPGGRSFKIHAQSWRAYGDVGADEIYTSLPSGPSVNIFSEHYASEFDSWHNFVYKLLRGSTWNPTVAHKHRSEL